MTEFVSFYLLFIMPKEMEIVAYIGATKDPYRRMSEHLINTREPIISRYSSSDLAKIAKKRKMPIHVLFLEVGLFDQRERIHIEGAWIAAAKQSGFRLPGVERWGNLSPGGEIRSMNAVLQGLGNAPRISDLFVTLKVGRDQTSAFQCAMRFAKGSEQTFTATATGQIDP